MNINQAMTEIADELGVTLMEEEADNIALILEDLVEATRISCHESYEHSSGFFSDEF
jgi:hypothetical protein